jgi:hypothetical protein
MRLLSPSTAASNEEMPVLPRDLGEPLEQPGADPLALQDVFDRERDLRPFGMIREAEILGDGDDRASRFTDERHHVVVVDPTEVTGPRLVDRREREETEVEAVRGEAPVEAQQRRRVLGPDRPKTRGRSGAEHDVALLVRRVGTLGGRGRSSDGAGPGHCPSVADSAPRGLIRLNHRPTSRGKRPRLVRLSQVRLLRKRDPAGVRPDSS